MKRLVILLSICICIVASTFVSPYFSYAKTGISQLNQESLVKTAMITANANNTLNITTINVVNLFYESNSGRVIDHRVLGKISSNSTEAQNTIEENGSIVGIGKVTNIGVYLDTVRGNGIIYGIGHGLMTTPAKDTRSKQSATWKSYDFGKASGKGVTTFRALMFFNTNSSSNLSFLNNLEALRITKVVGDKQTTKIWKWDN